MLGVCFAYDKDPTIRDEWVLNLNTFDVEGRFERNNPRPDEPNRFKLTWIKDATDLPLENNELIIVSPKDGRYIQGEISLVDFEHPKDAIYFFGTDEDRLRPHHIGEDVNYRSVYIPASPDLWSPQIGSIVLYDRMVKLGSNN